MRTKSGFSSTAFWTASSPLSTSQITCKSRIFAKVEQINRRNGAKSSATRTLTDDIAGAPFPGRTEHPSALDKNWNSTLVA
jgi:hypothetical protein